MNHDGINDFFLNRTHFFCLSAHLHKTFRYIWESLQPRTSLSTFLLSICSLIIKLAATFKKVSFPYIPIHISFVYLLTYTKLAATFEERFPTLTSLSTFPLSTCSLTQNLPLNLRKDLHPVHPFTHLAREKTQQLNRSVSHSKFRVASQVNFFKNANNHVKIMQLQQYFCIRCSTLCWAFWQKHCWLLQLWHFMPATKHWQIGNANLNNGRNRSRMQK